MTEAVLSGTPSLTPTNAVFIAEGITDATLDEQIAAWQYLHDTGLAYQLQGWYGRTAKNMIDSGLIKA